MTEFDEQSFYRVQVVLTTNSDDNSMYQGAVLRGWFLDSIYRNQTLQNYFFNRKYDVMPFFSYPMKSNGTNTLNVIFLNADYEKIRELVDAVAQQTGKKVGGTKFNVERVILNEEKYPTIEMKDQLNVTFLTPLALKVENRLQFAPRFRDIIVAGARSYNRYAKYYSQQHYPFHISDEIRNIVSENLHLDLEMINEYYINNQRARININGIIGSTIYRINISEDFHPELVKMLSLLNVIQIGKHISYGFGKLSIQPTDGNK